MRPVERPLTSFEFGRVLEANRVGQRGPHQQRGGGAHLAVEDGATEALDVLGAVLPSEPSPDDRRGDAGGAERLGKLGRLEAVGADCGDGLALEAAHHLRHPCRHRHRRIPENSKLGPVGHLDIAAGDAIGLAAGEQ